jgi:hypothetical protein
VITKYINRIIDDSRGNCAARKALERLRGAGDRKVIAGFVVLSAPFLDSVTAALSIPCPCGSLREENERLVKELVALRSRDAERGGQIVRLQELSDARDIDDASTIRKLETERDSLRAELAKAKRD